MNYLFFIGAPLYVLVLFTNNPIITWVDKWACKGEDKSWEEKKKPTMCGYTS